MDTNNRHLLIITVTILMLFVCFACSVQKKEKVERIDIEGNIKNFHHLNLSDICHDIEYIILETNNLCLINEIKYLEVSKKYILIYDWEKCLLFSRSGNFLTQISREGRGPGEYSHPGQIRIIDDEIFIPDANRNIIRIYSTKGNFIENVESPGKFTNQFQINNYLPITDSLFFVQIPNLTGLESTRVSLINRKGEVLINYENTTFFNREKPRFDSSDLAAQFYIFSNKIRYKELLNDTIWQIEQNKLIPIYVFDRGKFGTPNYIRGLPMKIFHDEITKSIFINNLYEMKSYIILKTNFMKQYPFEFFSHSLLAGDFFEKSPHNILGVYNKLGKKFFFIEPTNIRDQICPTGIENDIDGGINFIPEYKLGDTSLVSWLNAYDLKTYTSSKTFLISTPKYPEKKKELEQLANSLNENDNPILMLVKLKE